MYSSLDFTLRLSKEFIYLFFCLHDIGEFSHIKFAQFKHV